MAFRRDTIKRQFAEAEREILEPGEESVAGALTQSGPTPWLMGGVGFLIMYLMGMRIYFVSVTNRRVLFIKGSLWAAARPRGLAFADQRAGASLEDIKVAAVWSKARYRSPERDLRLNFHRIWRQDFERIVSELQRAAPTAPATDSQTEVVTPPPPPA
jgi:hypothetical protein